MSFNVHCTKWKYAIGTLGQIDGGVVPGYFGSVLASPVYIKVQASFDDYMSTIRTKPFDNAVPKYPLSNPSPAQGRGNIGTWVRVELGS